MGAGHSPLLLSFAREMNEDSTYRINVTATVRDKEALAQSTGTDNSSRRAELGDLSPRLTGSPPFKKY